MSRLKYKVGDRVKIQSLERYNKYKNRNGDINYGCETEILFTSEMSSFCGLVVTITRVRYIGCVRFYHIVEDEETHLWVDGMFECLVERNGKTYPYKIGDRVVLKGNNRCATITDLKYNSWGNLSYYIRIDNDKDISTDYPTDLLLPYDNKVEGFVEEETKPKNEDEKNGESKPKYEDEVNGEYYSTPKYLVRPSGYQFVDENGNVINAMKITLEKIVVPKFKKGDKIKDKNNRVWYVVQVGNKHFDISSIPDGPGYFVPMEDQDDYELFPDRELPKTFEECVNVLMLEGGNRMSLEQMNTFRKLIDARNAYWTIYGEENGLGKPWEPDYNNEEQPKYGLYDILKYSLINPSQFVFPTEEMRDTFYENFKKEIEQCKEL